MTCYTALTDGDVDLYLLKCQVARDIIKVTNNPQSRIYCVECTVHLHGVKVYSCILHVSM